MARRKDRKDQMRHQIAQYAARLMTESGVPDYQLAKQKAAAALGVSEGQDWPSNQELEAALASYQRLFESVEHPKRLQRLRRIALSAMNFLQPFQPRLVGPVLQGSATRHAVVELHLFCDNTDQIGFFLMDHGIPFEYKERSVRVSTQEHKQYPLYCFEADEVGIELVVFNLEEWRLPPLSSTSGKPMERATREEVERLLGQEENPGVHSA